MESIDLRDLIHQLRDVAVVRNRVMRVGDTDLAVGSHAGFAPQLEARDASKIGLIGQYLHVEHQLHVVGVFLRNAGRFVDAGCELLVIALRNLNTAFNFANARQVLIHLALVACA